jgi:hypothetical protein
MLYYRQSWQCYTAKNSADNLTLPIIPLPEGCMNDDAITN